MNKGVPEWERLCCLNFIEKFLKETREKFRLSVIAIACRHLVTEEESDCPQTAQPNHCVNDAADDRRLTAEDRAD